MDQLLVMRGLAASREEARRLIMAGEVRPADGSPGKPGRSVPADFDLIDSGPRPAYVSRGGLKLEAALRDFGVDPASIALAMDVGASTGGFTDCLLQKGAAEVIAVDTGRGQIHEKLRTDPRVRLMEQTNARHLALDQLAGRRPELVVMDVSFISIRLLLPALAGVLAPGGRILTLVKPQFEAGRGRIGSGGIVRDPAVHREVLESAVAHCLAEGWEVSGVTVSAVPGGGGNIEFFLLLDGPPPHQADESIRTDGGISESLEAEIESALAAARRLGPSAPPSTAAEPPDDPPE